MRTRWMLAACAAMVVAPAASSQATQPITVAVLYFDNNTGDAGYDVLQKGLADMLITDLSGVEVLQVVEREKLEAVLAELELQKSRYFDQKTAQKLGKGIGAQYVITGAFTAVKPKMRIDIRLVNVSNGKVVLADKVVGDSKEFFTLQTQLVAKFVGGLSITQKVAPTSGVTDLAALQAYSQAVDTADRGDLAAASKQLASVVRASPKFAMAKARYVEYERRLRLAAKRRKESLEDDETILSRNIDTVLAQDLRTLSSRDGIEYLGYRILKGQLLLQKIEPLAKPDSDDQWIGWAPKANRKQARKLLEDYTANTLTLIDELETFNGLHNDGMMWTRIRRDDRDLARNIGLPSGDEHLARGRVQVALARLLVLGDNWYFDPRVSYTPPLALESPKYAKRALDLLDQADAIFQANNDVSELGDAVDVRLECLVALGRPEEAIAHVQKYLDAYPKSPKFEDLETKVEELLGITPKAEEFAKLAPTCDPKLSSLVFDEMERLWRAGGGDAVDAALAELNRACKGKPASMGVMTTALYMAGVRAVRMGECKRFAAMEQLIRSNPNGAPFADTFATLGRSCQ